MQKQGTKWRYRAALAVLASCSLFAGAGADKKETPKPLPPDIVKAWRNAGAQVGWTDWLRDLLPSAPSAASANSARNRISFQIVFG